MSVTSRTAHLGPPHSPLPLHAVAFMSPAAAALPFPFPLSRIIWSLLTGLAGGGPEPGGGGGGAGGVQSQTWSIAPVWRTRLSLGW